MKTALQCINTLLLACLLGAAYLIWQDTRAVAARVEMLNRRPLPVEVGNRLRVDIDTPLEVEVVNTSPLQVEDVGAHY